MRSEVLYKVWSHGESRVVGGRSRNSQPVGFSRSNPQFLVNHFFQSLNPTASDLCAAVPDFGVLFPVLCQDYFRHSFLVSRVFKMYFLAL